MVWKDGLEPGSPAYKIASEVNGRIRVLAGPGTGKSFAMKRRIGRLLEEGISPSKILPVTFTRVSAQDLHRELVGMGVPGCDQLEATTLHRLCLRCLHKNSVFKVMNRHARPLNKFELDPMISDLMLEEGRGKKDIKELLEAFEAAWARLQDDEPGYAIKPEDAAFETKLISWLDFHKCILIGEVVPLFYRFLRGNPQADERTEYSHILVDEYQDLNKAEQGVIQLMADHAEVCIVGDDDQSIYSFKHAHPQGIRNWIDENSEAADIGLKECHRCPKLIVEMANHLIAKNSGHMAERQLIAMPQNGKGDVQIVQYKTLADEISGVSKYITELINRGIPPGDILVLAQSKHIGTPIFETITKAGIKKVRNEYSESELNTKEIQRAFALLKLFNNREDRVALRWLLGVNSSSWYSGGYKRIRAYCKENNTSPWATLEQLCNGTLSLSYTKPLVEAFRELKVELDQLKAISSDLLSLINHLFPEEQEKAREIRNVCLEILRDNQEITLEDFVNELVVAVAKPEIPSKVDDARVMSLHKSKGLSSPITIIVGCVDGLLPKRRKRDSVLSEEEHFEEQRRLFYVGITRVKAVPDERKPGTLILTYSKKMPYKTAKQAGIEPAKQKYGYKDVILHASRFIGELGPTAPEPKMALNPNHH